MEMCLCDRIHKTLNIECLTFWYSFGDFTIVNFVNFEL